MIELSVLGFLAVVCFYLLATYASVASALGRCGVSLWFPHGVVAAPAM